MRGLRPASHLSTQEIDAVVEAAERAVLIECSRRTGKTIFLKGGMGSDVPQALIAGGKVVGRSGEAELVARVLLPDTDLNAGAVAYDQWLTAALVAATEYQYVGPALQLRTDQVAAIYGVGTLDAAPHVGRVRLLTGTSVVMAAWDTTPIWAAQDTLGYADEFAMWSVQENINVWLMPYAASAGERFILLGVIAEPKGTGPITK